MSSSRLLAQDQLHHPLSPICPAIGPPSSPSFPEPSSQIDCRLEGSSTEKCTHLETKRWSTNVGRRRATIDMLPDVALLEIFDFYLNQREYDPHDYTHWFAIQMWHTLVHVCQKWRTVVFGSPHRLELRLFCEATTPVKETLAVWPPLPIVIGQRGPLVHLQMDNIIVALEHNDRVSEIIFLGVTNSGLGEVLAAMKQPFPELTRLDIWLLYDGLGWEVEDEIDETPVVPESFLGGFAPRLRDLTLRKIPFPGLPKLLLSATGLVTLYLFEIPHSGYISPEAMARCLSTLTSLESLSLEFKSPLSRPENRRPHPPTRPILLALTTFWFKGVSQYLEDLVARIDTPQLDSFYITFFHQLIFDIPQLTQFVVRTPNTQIPVEARIAFSSRDLVVTCPQTFARSFSLRISCKHLDWQLSSLAQVCNSSFPEAFIPAVEQLYIYEHEYSQPHWQDDIEDGQWLEVLHPFTAVKDLYLSREFTSRIAPALRELSGDVLPSLQNLFLEDLHPSGPVHGAIGKSVATRQLSGHPVTVSHWDRNQNKL